MRQGSWKLNVVPSITVETSTVNQLRAFQIDIQTFQRQTGKQFNNNNKLHKAKHRSPFNIWKMLTPAVIISSFSASLVNRQKWKV